MRPILRVAFHALSGFTLATSTVGWAHPTSLVLAIASVACLVTFAWVEWRIDRAATATGRQMDKIVTEASRQLKEIRDGRWQR